MNLISEPSKRVVATVKTECSERLRVIEMVDDIDVEFSVKPIRFRRRKQRKSRRCIENGVVKNV